MIEPNFTFMLWAMLITNGLLAVMYMIAAAIGLPKKQSTHYGKTDFLVGVTYLTIFLITIST